MAGTFKNGDLLIIQTPDYKDIRTGDVIVYRKIDGPTGQADWITHRVTKTSGHGFVTRGDACLKKDKERVTPETFVGRVFGKERKGRIAPVHGGWRGLLRGRCLNCCWRGRQIVAMVLKKPYSWLRRSGIVAKIWKPTVHCVRINSTDGPYLQYIFNRTVVAKYWPEKKRFVCRKPWDLVIHCD